MDEKLAFKAQTLIEALPYIKEFQGKKFVVKIGGSAFDKDFSIIEDIALLHFVGFCPVIVHGGGELISNLSEKLGKKSKFYKGYRITDEEEVKIVEMVLSGLVNKNIVSMLNRLGAKAVGISGTDANLLTAKKLVLKGEVKDIGFVGEIEKVNNEILDNLLKLGYIVVISPVARDSEGKIYNINADIAAAKVSISISAEKIIYLTDVDGIYKNNKIIPKLNISEAEKLIKSGCVKEGMIPKLSGCMQAVSREVKAAHIINGKIEHSLLMEIFTNKGIGTMIKN